MCGIAGLIAGRDGTDLDSVGARMVSSLAHRGPDAHGVALLPAARGVFAHTRLKVIDLSERARQPFISEDGRIFLTFNGEIYNFKDLRTELEKSGARFRSKSDTEVILELYLHHDVQGLDALDGMFAFALYDARVDRLILMRDRFGKKPLYYAVASDGGFVFGSEVKALAAHAALSLEPDPSGFPEYLTYGYVGTPRTLYRGVFKLPPGSRLVLDARQPPVVLRYFSLDELGRRTTTMTLDETKASVRAAVGRAVERRLVSDVSLGAFLSGGIDSSIVVAEIAQRSSARVRTFAVGFDDDPTYDETRFAREVSALFDTEHMEIRVRPSAHPEDLLAKLLRHHDEPYGDSSAVALFAVAEATQPYVTVVLTGDGGDEMFAGYTRFRGGLFLDAVPSAIQSLVSRGLRRVPEPRGYKNPLALLARFVEHPDRDPDEQFLAWNTYFSGSRLAAILRADVYGGAFDPWSVLAAQVQLLQRERTRGRDRLDQILRHNIETYLLDDLLVKADRMTMAVALEARSPFLDRDLADVAFGIPSRLKVRHGRLKWILREAYRDVLPPSILDRRKHGFGVPVSRWWSNELRAFVDDLLLSRGGRTHEYLVAESIRRLLEEHRGGRRDHGQRIFALVQLELWLRGLGERHG